MIGPGRKYVRVVKVINSGVMVMSWPTLTAIIKVCGCDDTAVRPAIEFSVYVLKDIGAASRIP